MSAPLIALVSLAYIGVAIDQALKGNGPMALVWAGYVIANIGFIWALK